jgi:bacterioferritin (cytochrome b1)
MPIPFPESVDALQRSANLHWTAIEHYASMAAHLTRIGYAKLGARFDRDAEEERGHLRRVLDRLEFFRVQVSYDHAQPSWPSGDVPGMLTASLSLESYAAVAERHNIVASRSIGDEGSTVVFVELLAGSETSIRELEADIFLIGQMGLDNWLANQM